ncbi:MAG: patatin-like phospholipase family protein [Pyrinomonadaceae bacterium]
MPEKKIGLALSGGGARGFAHAGVLKALADNQIPIGCIAGTSAGSLVGAGFASGLSADELIRLSEKINWYSMSGFSYSPRGLLSNASMGKFIEANFPVATFEDLKIPFAAVVCDLAKGEEVVLRDRGDLATAVRASCAIPGVFVPVAGEDGRWFVDGGVVSPMPTRAVKNLGADIIIAVDLLSCVSPNWGTPSTLLGMLFQSAMLMLRTAARNQHYRASIVIEPQIGHIRPDEMGRRDELIELGEKAARESLDKINALIDNA